jgi:hypothetical protein
VLVIATLGAPERRFRDRSRTKRPAARGPEPAPVTTGRATIIEAGEPLPSEAAARGWLEQAGEDELASGLAVLNRALHAFRVVTADPHRHTITRAEALVARVGFGAGMDVADGLWIEARELIVSRKRERRHVILTPQARLAAALTGQERVLACQELALRARLDFDEGRPREAALQVLIALDAAIAELPTESKAHDSEKRLEELRGRRETTAQVAQAALAGELDEAQRGEVEFTLKRIEAALRARAVASA